MQYWRGPAQQTLTSVWQYFARVSSAALSVCVMNLSGNSEHLTASLSKATAQQQSVLI